MITIQDYNKTVLAQGGSDGSIVQGEISTNRACVIYIDYNKGDETSLTLTFDVYFDRIDDYYPITSENSSVVPVNISADSETSADTYQTASILVKLSSDDSNSSSLEPLTKVITKSGKYRLIIPVADNEDKLRVNAQLVGTASNSGSALITISPISIAI